MNGNREHWQKKLEERLQEDRRRAIQQAEEFSRMVTEANEDAARCEVARREREFWELCCASYNNETPINDGYTHSRGRVNASLAAAIADAKLTEWRKRWLQQ